jgi:hypothetical protein
MFGGTDLYTSDEAVKKAFLKLECANERPFGFGTARVEFMQDIMREVENGEALFGDISLLLRDRQVQEGFKELADLEKRLFKDPTHSKIYLRDMLDMARETFLKTISDAVEAGVGRGVPRQSPLKGKAVRAQVKKSAGVPVVVAQLLDDHEYQFVDRSTIVVVPVLTDKDFNDWKKGLLSPARAGPAPAVDKGVEPVVEQEEAEAPEPVVEQEEAEAQEPVVEQEQAEAQEPAPASAGKSKRKRARKNNKAHPAAAPVEQEEEAEAPEPVVEQEEAEAPEPAPASAGKSKRKRARKNNKAPPAAAPVEQEEAQAPEPVVEQAGAAAANDEDDNDDVIIMDDVIVLD